MSAEQTMIAETPCGNVWHIEDVDEKLRLRATLPGASVYDACTRSFMQLEASGIALATVLPLTWGASWMVNSPATSKTMQTWLEPRAFATWLDLVGMVREGEHRIGAISAAVDALWPSLGTDETKLETLTKVLALLAPDDVPHMTKDTCDFVLGAAPGADSFVPFLSWWRAATQTCASLAAISATLGVGRGAGAALDRLLWFDVVGHAHFPGA